MSKEGKRARKSSPAGTDLRLGEHRCQDLLDQVADGVFLLDDKGNFLMANAQLCRMLRCTAEELLRLNIIDTYPAHLREEGMARLEAINAGQSQSFVREMKRADGSVFLVEMKARRLPEGTLQGIARDITEHARAQSELALERSLVASLMANIPDYIYFKDAQSRFLRISSAHARAFGLQSPEEAVGRTDTDFFSEEHARRAHEQEQRIIQSGEPLVNVEERETWPDRPDTWVLSTKMPLRDGTGKIIGTFGISRDITEQKHAQERVLALVRFLEEDPHPVMRIAPDGSVLYGNRASAAMTASWGDSAQRTVPAHHLEAISAAWRAGEKREIELQEGPRAYAVTVVPVAAEGYINLYGRDVTEEKALAERLTQAQKMEAVGQLTGGVAHDFNNVLQVILGYCELLTRRVREEENRYVAEIAGAARRAAALTTQLLAFSRKQILRPRSVDLKDLIVSMRRMLERVIGEDITLQTFVDPDTGNVLADPGQIEQVLLNLAVNARDAMPLGGTITIETSNRTFDDAYVRDHPGAQAGHYVRIAVSDTGVGMDAHTMEHIYEPFFTTKEKGKGTGLGLSTVYGIVRQSDGYINCYSEPGQGTTFTIYLPLTLQETAAAPRPAALPAVAPRGTETVLLVDDDAAARRVAAIALEEAGYSVIEASDAEEALSGASAGGAAVDLLVTDVVLPRISGRELARRIAGRFPQVNVLYVSGYTANVISHHGILEAGLDFLEKPFSSLELLTRVREILDRRRA